MFYRISFINPLLNDVITTPKHFELKHKYFYRVSRQIYYKIGWFLQHVNRNFGINSCLLSLNNQQIAKTVKNDVIMTS